MKNLIQKSSDIRDSDSQCLLKPLTLFDVNSNENGIIRLKLLVIHRRHRKITTIVTIVLLWLHRNASYDIIYYVSFTFFFFVFWYKLRCRTTPTARWSTLVVDHYWRAIFDHKRAHVLFRPRSDDVIRETLKLNCVITC